ncbi:MAG TPA: hypothetical protein VLZ83_10315 [Edaphocola sp.]|nr:hypothetical protein [Edaphocola sp.]
MLPIYGEYKISLDTKGRLLLPADYCKQLAEEERLKFYVKSSKDGCVVLYTVSQWAKIDEELNKLSMLRSDAARYKRAFLDGVRLIEVDTANRILIPKHVQESAGFVKEIVFWAIGSNVEIWDAGRKAEYVAKAREELEDLEDKLLG